MGSVYAPAVFEFAPWSGSCCPPLCDRCSGSMPSQFQVVIAGAADKNCPDCDTYDGTYVLDFQEITGPGNCRWLYEFSGPCNTTELMLLISEVGDPPYDYQISISFDGVYGEAWVCSPACFRKVYDTKIDCSNLSNEDIPETHGDQPTSPCDWSGATCKVTAL